MFFLFQDELIEKEKASYAISGGCCALAALHLMGKLYVANAGDSRWEKLGFIINIMCQQAFFSNSWLFFLCRAIIIRNNEVIPMTNEFTPESERQRLQYLVFLTLISHNSRHICACWCFHVVWVRGMWKEDVEVTPVSPRQMGDDRLPVLEAVL